MCSGRSYAIKHLWVAVVLNTTVTIWKSRNALSFEEENLSIQRCKNNIRTPVLWSVNLLKSRDCCSDQDVLVLNRMGLPNHNKIPKTVKKIQWFPLGENEIKANTNNSVQGD